MSAPTKTLSAEQAADLAALQAAASAEPVAPGAPEAVPEVARPELADEIRALLLTFVSLAGPVLPSLPRIYTEETAGTAAAAIATVCRKHGWLADGMMGDWGEEIAAAVVLLPLGFATVQGVRADLAALRKPAAKPGQVAAPMQDAPQSPGAREVIIGAPIVAGADHENP